MERRQEALTVLVLVLGLALASVGAYRLLGHEGWYTGARNVVWVDAEGRPLSEEVLSYGVGCHGDINLTTLVDGASVWTACTSSEALPHGGLARIDPGEGRGETAWRMPPELPLGWVTLIAPGPKAQLGVVYRVHGPANVMAVAIAGPHGWVRAPEFLMHDEGGQVLAAAWRGDRFEVASLRPAGVTISAYAIDGPAIEEVTPVEDVCPPLPETALGPSVTCQIQGAYVRDGESRWRFVVNRSLAPKDPALDVTREGETTPMPLGSGPLFYQVDFSVAGRLVENPITAEHVLMADGSVVPAASPPSLPGQLSPFGGHYLRDGALLRRVPSWLVMSSGTDFVYQVGERYLLMQYVVSETEQDELLTVQELAASGVAVAPPTVLARAFSFACGDLTQAAFVPRPEGGWWAVQPRGCYVALDADGTRADPLTVSEHLERRGSIGMDWHEWWHFGSLMFVLMGLPLALVLAGGSAWLLARSRRVPVRGIFMRHAQVSVAVYLLVGVYALSELWPLMR